MRTPQLPTGKLHTTPSDLSMVLTAHAVMQVAWQGLTPLARNEWICWIESAKLIDTRRRRLEQARTKLVAGARRPCCWPGCMHRTKTSIKVSEKPAA